ncbi:MAG: hypothetical protein QOH12_1017 [Solirubrobacteraceae bacterium]|jgi:diguanylate cyclase (GGDEF)-like protein/PAS domain S-box-containing protein|nr:hypothetical protein [Solirubrobacteraceae bacterium]
MPPTEVFDPNDPPASAAGSGHPRDGTAEKRDQAAQRRDDVAAQRDLKADIADRRALELDGVAVTSESRTPEDRELVARGLEGRQRAARDRRRAKSDRILAEADRESGESDREESRAWGHLAALVDSSEDAIIAKSLVGEIETWNRAAEELFGYTAAEAVGHPLAMLVPPERREEYAWILAKLESGERIEPLETIRLTKDGRRIDVALRISLVHDADGKVVGAASSSRDITERVRMQKAMRAAEERFHTAFDRAPIGICLLSLEADDARLLQVNAALATILGRPSDELIGAPLGSLAYAEDREEATTRLRQLTLGHTDHVEFEQRLIHRDGHAVWVLLSSAVLSEGDGQQTLAITHVMDISDRKRSERQLQHLADHDALTGLFNRRRFAQELQRSLRLSARHRDPGAVLFLDLDGFKFVNDTLGHAAGDKLIVRVGRLLAAVVRETDTLARIGGDEFAVLLNRCDGPAALVVAEKLLATLRRDAPTEHGDRRPHVSSSIGIAMFGEGDLLGPDELVVQADIAMYEAKRAGKDRCAVYDRTAGPNSLMSIRQSWNERLRRAIRDDSFVLHAQPISPIGAGGTPAFELLIRLPDNNGDLIAPAAFLFDAEESGLVGKIDYWVLEQAVQRLHDSHAAGQDLMLSINVSGRTMSDPGLGDHLAALLSRTSIPRGRLIVEITETAAIKNLDCARTLAGRLRGLGCMLAIDDFGAGFASFSYLKLLHFDYLKIDGEFIRNLCATPTDQLVVEAIVTLARGLGTRTIAEFVGDGATVSRLRELGVDYAQGYHVGRPSPLDERLPYLISLPVGGRLLGR